MLCFCTHTHTHRHRRHSDDSISVRVLCAMCVRVCPLANAICLIHFAFVAALFWFHRRAPLSLSLSLSSNGVN